MFDAFRGHAFEQRAIFLLSWGGSFLVRKLDENLSSPPSDEKLPTFTSEEFLKNPPSVSHFYLAFPPSDRFQFKNFTELKKFHDINPRLLFYPLHRNFPAIDFVAPPGIPMNSTQSSSHKITVTATKFDKETGLPLGFKSICQVLGLPLKQ